MDSPARRRVRSVASQGRSEQRRARRGRGIFQQENIRDLGRNPRGLRLSVLKKLAAINYKTDFNLSRTSFNNSTDVLKLWSVL